MLTDKSGKIVWQGRAKAFGETTEIVNLIANPLRFPGQYYDRETGMHYNYFRYYDPEVGRYIASDPVGLDGGINTYGYVLGNPANWDDPYGLESPVDNGDWIGGVCIRDKNCFKNCIQRNYRESYCIALELSFYSYSTLILSEVSESLEETLQAESNRNRYKSRREYVKGVRQAKLLAISRGVGYLSLLVSVGATSFVTTAYFYCKATCLK